MYQPICVLQCPSGRHCPLLPKHGSRSGYLGPCPVASWVPGLPARETPSRKCQSLCCPTAQARAITSRECGCMTRRSRNKFDVVLAKARTHYPKSQSLREAGAAIPFITERGGYGSWLSPGRRLGDPAPVSITVILRCERSEPRRMRGPAGGRRSFETRYALLRMTGLL